jgi:hypothetical protein
MSNVNIFNGYVGILGQNILNIQHQTAEPARLLGYFDNSAKHILTTSLNCKFF